jgi:hypothetical protein
MAKNQGPPQGAFEDRVLQKGGFNTPLGNALARNVGKGGPGSGREVMRSGAQGQRGQSEREYSNPAMDDLDRYYGYGKVR